MTKCLICGEEMEKITYLEKANTSATIRAIDDVIVSYEEFLNS